jgi:hypothetical protein
VLDAELFFVSEPEPEMTPENVWFVDDAKTKLDDVPIVIACEYVPDPSVPVSEIVPPDAAMVVLLV